MANWQRTIRLQPHWGQVQAEEITTQEMASVIAAKLKSLRPFNNYDIDEERDFLVEDFEAFANSKGADTEDFDAIMARLYDWGDTRLDNNWNGKKVCWIDTLSGVEMA